MFCNRNFLKDICYAREGYIIIHCNAVTRQYTMGATLPRFGTVWFDKGGIANILSVIKVSKEYKLWLYHNKDVFIVLEPTYEVIF